MTIVTNFVTFLGVRGSTSLTFVKDFVTFGGSWVNFGDLWGFRGVNFVDLCEGFCDLWGVRGSTLVTFLTNLVTFGGSVGSGGLC